MSYGYKFVLLYLIVIFFFFFFSLREAEIDLKVVTLQESRVHYMNTSKQSCYKNVLIPKWHDVWTRIQVMIWRLWGVADFVNI